MSDSEGSGVAGTRAAMEVLRAWVDWCDYPDGGDIDTNELRERSLDAYHALAKSSAGLQETQHAHFERRIRVRVVVTPPNRPRPKSR